jgi:broad specificity phosphatase PhoE
MNRKSRMKLVLSQFLRLSAMVLVIFCMDAGFLAVALAQEGQPTWVFVLRHAERGNEPDPPLTPDGLKRAEQLRQALAWASVSRIFVTPTKRSIQTAAPLAGCLCPEGDPLKCCQEYPYTSNTEADVKALTEKVFPSYQGKVVAIVAHSDTVESIVRALTGKPLKGFDAAYDNLFVLSVTEPSHGAVLHLKYGFPATLQECK